MFIVTHLIYLKARTILLHSRQVPMSCHTGFGIIFLQPLQQLVKRILLLRCAGIGRPSADVQTSFVTDADAVLVVACGVCPYGVEGTPGMNRPVAGDVVVIADVGKATGTVVTTAVFHGITPGGAGGTTVNHYQADATVVLVPAAV